MEQWLAYKAHNLGVGGSNPSPATKGTLQQDLLQWFIYVGLLGKVPELIFEVYQRRNVRALA